MERCVEVNDILEHFLSLDLTVLFKGEELGELVEFSMQFITCICVTELITRQYSGSMLGLAQWVKDLVLP